MPSRRLSFPLFSFSLSLAFAASPAAARAADTVPSDLVLTRFSGPDITPCVACLCVSASGEVYAGVDLNGSLGKGPGKGRIVKLLDRDHDGVADSHTIFAMIDNPRGLIAVGTKLYVLHTAHGPDGKATGMDLAVLEDADGDGIADGPEKVLVRNICVAKAINDRGTDHSTNGIRMGIDGWIYIAVGDFGFVDATGTDGTKLTLLGGGIVRVRPDGTELEQYTTGTRNIYDIAIDPFMNCFTRGNTNDGGGWNIRFLHHVQSADFGYPRLFKNFATEILPALEDLGGGAGVGAYFLSEPTWPEKYNNQPLMADWGRKAIYLHRLTVDGPTFTQSVEEFAQVSQVTDLDVDPAGQMFVSAWDGAGFKGDAGKGYVSRLTPEGWTYHAAPDFAQAKPAELVALLASPSATTRLYAQQEILARPAAALLKPALAASARNAALAPASRVAALFTLAQIENDPRALLAFADDNVLCEFALRTATDRLPRLKNANLPIAPFVQRLQSGTPRQRAVAAVSLGRLGNPAAAPALLAVPFIKPPDETAVPVTEKFTLKNNRDGRTTLTVKAGDELRLHLQGTNNPTEPVRIAVREAWFTRADGTKVNLSTLTPRSGRVTSSEVTPPPTPSPAADATKTKKGGKQGRSAPFLIAEGPATIVYTVPADALVFEFFVTPVPGPAGETSVDMFASTGPIGTKVETATGPRHATPNSGIVLPHLAAHALIQLRAIAPSLAAVGTLSEDLALWTLSRLHDESVVTGLLQKLDAESTPAARAKLLTTLARLHHQETAFDGLWWWSTRPDTRGPYYKPMAWSATPRIADALEAEVTRADPAQLDFLARLNDSHRLGLKKLGTRQPAAPAEKAPQIDLAKIAAQQGAVGTTAIEDLVLAVERLKPNHAHGEALFTQQGCIACHALAPGGPALGPFMGQIGSIMNPAQIATAIVRPSDTISQGFQTVVLTMKDGTTRTGFMSESNVDTIMLRDMTGAVTKIATADVKEEKHLPTSMMPEGLANALSLDDFAALVHFLASKK